MRDSTPLTFSYKGAAPALPPRTSSGKACRGIARWTARTPAPHRYRARFTMPTPAMHTPMPTRSIAFTDLWGYPAVEHPPRRSSYGSRSVFQVRGVRQDVRHDEGYAAALRREGGCCPPPPEPTQDTPSTPPPTTTGSCPFGPSESAPFDVNCHFLRPHPILPDRFPLCKNRLPM